MADPRTELAELRRLAELEAKASGSPMPATSSMDMSNVSRPDGSQYDPYNPTAGMSGPQMFLAGAGKALTDIYRGGAQALGVMPESEIAAARERDKPLMETGAGMAGNIAGNVAAFLPTAMIPGANTYTGAALTGAAIGALQPVVEGESRLENAAIGGAGGAAGQGLANALSRVLSPQTSAAARSLIDEGVTPTPGQIMGGAPQRIESALEGIPFLGRGILKAKERAAQQYNVAALNRVLAPIGKSVKSAGYEGLEQARNLASSAFDDAIGVLKRVDIDPQFDSAMGNITQMTATLPDSMQGQFSRILSDKLLKNITPAKTMSGETFQTAHSQLNRLAAGYKKSVDFDQRQLGDALGQVAEELQWLAARANPQAGEMLQKAREAWSMLLRVENAAGRAGAVEGVFSPAQLGAASRQMDTSLRKIGTTQGNAVMQDFADAGRQVLGETLPNSGTAERGMAMALLGGSYWVDPSLAAAVLAGRGAYTPVGQKALAAALAKRTPAMRAGGGVLRRLAPAAALGGSSLAVQQ